MINCGEIELHLLMEKLKTNFLVIYILWQTTGEFIFRIYAYINQQTRIIFIKQ